MTNSERIGIPEDQQGQIRSWLVMSLILEPFSLDDQTRRFAQDYFNAQRFIAEGKLPKANELFQELGRNQEYLKFEDQSGDILWLIDVAVKGSSNQKRQINS